MAHSFCINLDEDLEHVLQKVGTAITSKGGDFQGNTEKGSFAGHTPIGTIRGEYRCSSDNTISITITSKPFLVPYSLIESEIRQYFG